MTQQRSKRAKQTHQRPLEPDGVGALDASIEQSLSQARFAQALQLIELRQAVTFDLALLGPTVLCLAATGQKERAQALAVTAAEALAELPEGPRRQVLLAALRVGHQLAAGFDDGAPKAAASVEALWGPGGGQGER